MKVGVFHPALDLYGGAEVVAVVVANALAESGYEVELFVNRKINQETTKKMTGEKIFASVREVLNPAFLQPRGTFHLYESAAKSLIFKRKCDLLVDTYSCYVFPWTDVCYMHFPYLNNYTFRPSFPYLRKPNIRDAITVPYAILEKNLEDYDKKLVLANSHFTAKVIKESLGADSRILYPPIPSMFFQENSIIPKGHRENLVVTIARFGQGKGVEIVPKIAGLTDKNIHFVMIGLLHDRSVLDLVIKMVKKLGLENRLRILTNASRDEIKSILARAKVYLHTTIMEHFGMSIAEAMAMGCLPIVHNSGGAKEFVPTEYRYENPQEAAKKIETAVCEWSPQKMSKMMETAERFSEANFSKRFMKLFSEYIKSQE